ncbi:MAG: hypothetical protein DWQ08_02590 [Proteobacteria bacterium]|nr:MAG: hypothetical protein DWQ08_02590 [Pseudomonadota bacterium]
MRLRALLPHGLPGRVLLERELGTFDELRPAIQSLLDSPRVGPPSLDIELGGMRITGRLADLRGCGLFHLRLRKLQARDRIRFIIEHLAGSAAGVLPGEPSRLVTLDASHALAPIDADVARSLFTPWLDAFRQGLSRPIHFFPKSAFAFVEAKDRTRGLGAAERAWTGSERSRGECESPYYRKLFGGRVPIDKAFESVTTDLLVPVLGIMTRT